MNQRRMYRYQIPVDDRPHILHFRGPIRHVASRSPEIVEVWAEHDLQGPDAAVTFQVVGTGQSIPDGAQWVGTALAPAGLVWHLYEVSAVRGAS